MSKPDKWYRADGAVTAADYPSFSSSLLEEIYRSIDDNRQMTEQRWRREKQTSSKPENFAGYPRRKPAPAEFSGRRFSRRMLKSSSSSSESSFSGGMSSSDADSFSGGSLKPIRTNGAAQVELNINRFDDRDLRYNHRKKGDEKTMKSYNNGGGSSGSKTKARALKLYSDLKKVKQPISPGGKLANFLNILFNSGTTKNPKISSSPCPTAPSNSSKSERESTTHTTTTTPCSTASSLSRSCLTKMTSFAAAKRSVRFAGENLEKRDYFEIKEEYLMKIVDDDEEEDDENDDEASCSSSDLFELENWLEIGGERYEQELPVYETTHVGTNRAIASGFIV